MIVDSVWTKMVHVQQQIHTTGGDYLHFVYVALKVKLIDTKAFAMMSSMIMLKSNSKCPASRESQDNQCCSCLSTTRWIGMWGICYSLCLKPHDPNITLQKRMWSDVPFPIET